MPGSHLFLWDKIAGDWVKGLGDDEGKLVLSSESPIPVGKIPDGGTQVVVGLIAQDQILDIYTVSDTKTLYLSNITVSIRNESGGVAGGYVRVRDQDDNWQYYIVSVAVPNNNSELVSISLCPPLEIAEKWDIAAYSSANNLRAVVFIHGYEM